MTSAAATGFRQIVMGLLAAFHWRQLWPGSGMAWLATPVAATAFAQDARFETLAVAGGWFGRVTQIAADTLTQAGQLGSQGGELLMQSGQIHCGRTLQRRHKFLSHQSSPLQRLGLQLVQLLRPREVIRQVIQLKSQPAQRCFRLEQQQQLDQLTQQRLGPFSLQPRPRGLVGHKGAKGHGVTNLQRLK